ncbi:MAG: hypothetical protein RBR18_08645 [Desulfovibrionaceae bacterium]|nr:hypothetical protein [Desulfovibrionaceae bacterium]
MKRRFTAYSRLNSDRFIQNLYNVKNEFVKNYKSNNWNYFNSNFIFTSHDDVKASRKKSKFNFNIILTLIFISISFFAIGIYYTKNLNSNLQTNQNNNEIIQNNNDRKTQKIKISSPEYYGNPQIPPKNGYTKNLTRSKDRAPLVIKTQNNETFFLVKLADLNGHDVKIIFIHGGMDIETKMPLGKYILKYATGSTWYGWDNYFGAETQYYKADEVFDFHTENNIISGYTVELYLQINGNLYTSKINEQEF